MQPVQVSRISCRPTLRTHTRTSRSLWIKQRDGLPSRPTSPCPTCRLFLSKRKVLYFFNLKRLTVKISIIFPNCEIRQNFLWNKIVRPLFPCPTCKLFLSKRSANIFNLKHLIVKISVRTFRLLYYYIILFYYLYIYVIFIFFLKNCLKIQYMKFLFFRPFS